MRFEEQNLQDLKSESKTQITIIGGSELFQGAPLLSLLTASRLVDTVFLATPNEDKTIIDKEELFSRLRSVIWVPKEDLYAYIIKSDAILIGPGLMRFHSENSNIEFRNSKIDGAGEYTRELTRDLLSKFPRKQWVIDGGSLQVMDPDWIPAGAILTPNLQEFELLFNDKFSMTNTQKFAKKYKCVILGKNHTAITYVSDGREVWEIEGGNTSLSRGGVGDTLAGVVVGLAANNPPLLAAAAGSFLIKKAADQLFEKVGTGYNADDLADKVFEVKKELCGY